MNSQPSPLKFLHNKFLDLHNFEWYTDAGCCSPVTHTQVQHWSRHQIHAYGLVQCKIHILRSMKRDKSKHLNVWRWCWLQFYYELHQGLIELSYADTVGALNMCRSNSTLKLKIKKLILHQLAKNSSQVHLMLHCWCHSRTTNCYCKLSTGRFNRWSQHAVITSVSERGVNGVSQSISSSGKLHSRIAWASIYCCMGRRELTWWLF